VFPRDPALPRLRDVVEPGAALHALNTSLPGCRAGVDRVVGCRVTTVRWRPTRRTTLRLDLRLRSCHTGSLRPQTLYAKVYHDTAKALRGYEALRRVTETVANDAVRFVAPSPVAVLPELPMVLMQPLAGTPMRLLVEGRRFAGAADEVMVRAGRGLADLHGLRQLSRPNAFTAGRRVTAATELERVGRRAARVLTVDPALGEAMAALHGALAIQGWGLAPGPADVAFVHGDCKPSQFLIGRGHAPVALLDFDSAGVGDAASDVGAFMASLRQARLRALERGHDTASEARLVALRSRFLSAYTAASGRGEEFCRRAAWWEAVTLLRKAQRAFARCPFSPLPAELVREGELCL
jgi:aminoglycoside phosphotransferase (APT) family kinase protein